MKDTMCGLVKEVNAPSGLVYHTDLPIPEINDDEVLIKVHCSAICGTDLHIMEWDEWSQKRIKAPVTVGHETAGEIVAVGKNVTERKVGDRVSCESHIPCGECYFCKNGMPHICKNVKLFGCTQNGAFAEYAKIRWDCTFLLEDDVTDEAACMFEPMGAGIHGVEAAEVNGKTVLVSGCGPIGLTAISASKTFGAVKVNSVSIEAAQGWSLAAFGDKTTLAHEKVNANKFGFQISLGNGEKKLTDSKNASKQTLLTDAIEGCFMSGVGDTSANSIGIAYDAIVTPVSEAVTNTAIASVLFIIAWDAV